MQETKWLSEKPCKRVSEGKKSPHQPLRVCRPPLPKGAAKAQPSGGFTESSEAMRARVIRIGSKLCHPAVAPGRHWWIGCLLAVLITGKGCANAAWAAADKPSSEKTASSLEVLKLQDGLLTAHVTAAPLQRVMSELSRLSGARIVWLGQRDNRQVSVDFTALPVTEALRRLLGPNNFRLM